MSTSPSQTSEPSRGSSDAGKAASDLIEQALASCLAVPQKLMQINLEAATHADNFMDRRMKAQAALWTSIGSLSDTNGAVDAQRTLLETITKAVASAPLTGFPAARSF